MIVWLTQDQIDLIECTLVKHGLTSEALQDDLIDHVCCLVENRMETGNTFEDALAISLQEFGVKGVAKVQHQTKQEVLNTDRFGLGQALNYFATTAVLLLALFFAFLPLVVFLSSPDLPFVSLAFLQFAFVGWYLLLKKVNYRRYELIQNES